VEKIINDANKMMEEISPEKLLLQTREKLEEESPIVNYKRRVDRLYLKEAYFEPYEKKQKNKDLILKYFGKLID